ncbi:MAG: serpin family protein, partial [Candidatus Limnocylindrales bacterium]
GAPGPGLQVGDGASIERPTLILHTPRFEVRGSHDLAQAPGVFGLAAAMDPSVGHFPDISAEPLFLSAARQDAIAIFTAEGFEAAAVTAVAMRPTSMRRPSGRTYRQITVSFDRPFGFLAVHRPTGLILVAGWVTEPEKR